MLFPGAMIVPLLPGDRLVAGSIVSRWEQPVLPCSRGVFREVFAKCLTHSNVFVFFVAKSVCPKKNNCTLTTTLVR